MNKVSITLDLSKINKTKITERSYANKAGETKVVKDYKVELIPVKEPKIVTQGQDWVMEKTHFVVESQTKEEKANKVPTVYVGEGFSFRTEEAQTVEENVLDRFDYPENAYPAEIPF